MRTKSIVLIVIILLFVILMNLSIKIFNTMDAWVGITVGVLSVIGFVFAMAEFVKSILKK